MTTATRLADVVGVPVRVGTVRVGEVSGVFLDERWERVLGLEVASTDGVRRFLPWPATELVDRAVHTPSALLLVEEAASYERLGAVTVRRPSHLSSLEGSADGTVVVPGNGLAPVATVVTSVP